MTLGPVRYVMIGGFLGAGKTTSILRFAGWLADRGLRVGLVTNDQAGGLADTALARAHGLAVEEITGGCFCCRFTSLVEAAEALVSQTAPDVLVAEPVGSCTDLVATVSLPLEAIHGDRFVVAPVSVVVDPNRAERVLGLAAAKFSDHVAYVYRKQLEEAEVVVVNKCELVDRPRLDRLREALAAAAPRATILEASAREGIGLDRWFSGLVSARSQAVAIAEIDYDRYALGESLLGWLNAEIRLGETAGDEFDGNRLLADILGSIRTAAELEGLEIAHLKGTLSVEGDPHELAAGNLVRTADAAVLSHRLSDPVDVGRLLLNLRAEAVPETLEACVRQAVAEACGSLPWAFVHLEHFRPGRPVPTHRLPVRS